LKLRILSIWLSLSIGAMAAVSVVPKITLPPPPVPDQTNNAIAVAAMALSTNAQAVIRAMLLVPSSQDTTNPPGSVFPNPPANPPVGVSVAWDKSSGSNVVAYRVYWGVASRQYTNRMDDGGNLTAVITNLVMGTTYYLAATAVTDAGLESGYSNEAVYSTPSVPPPPTNFIILKAQASLSPWGPWRELGSLPMVAGATNSDTFFRLAIARSD
jgi:hypothetical protein